MGMTKYQMSDEEIKLKWARGGKKVPDVRCLADLNAVDVPTMRQKLIELGCDSVPDMTLHKNKTNPPVPHDDAYALYLQHMSDADIGAQVGLSATAIRKWRAQWGYPDISKDGRKGTAISIKALADMIDQIAKVCPDALVAVGGQPVTRIQVTSSLELGGVRRVDISMGVGESVETEAPHDA